MKNLILIGFLLLFALGIASAAPRFLHNFLLEPIDDIGTQGKENAVKNEAESQVVSLALDVAKTVLPIIAEGAKGLAKYVLCDELAQLQEYRSTGNEERDAKIMALVKIMGDLHTTKEVDKFKQLNVQDNRVAEAELFDWAKEYLCD